VYKRQVLTTVSLLNNLPGLERFVFISTANVYFNAKDRLNVKEDDPLPSKYLSFYPLTKLEAETKVLEKKTIHSIVLRPRGVIGPGDTTAFPRLMDAFKEKKIRITGSGENVIDLTSVRNLAYASLLALNSGEQTRGQVYNITDGSTHKFWSLLKDTAMKLGYNTDVPRMNYWLLYGFARMAELTAKISNRGEPLIQRYGVNLLKTSFTLNINKAIDQLAYSPVISTEECIDDFLEWANISRQE
jgi:nucleoside-diphosphate-sugar epimerase